MKNDNDMKPMNGLTREVRQQIAEDFVGRNVFINQDYLVRKCLETELFELDDVDHLYDEFGDAQEIYSWILVELWVADKLRSHDEPILQNGYGIWWGRTSGSQAYHIDSVIESIAVDVHYS